MLILFHFLLFCFFHFFISFVGFALDRAMIPLEQYLTFFSKFDDFLNINNETHVASQIKAVRRDPDSSEIELPLQVDLTLVTALLNHHQGTYVQFLLEILDKCIYLF